MCINEFKFSSRKEMYTALRSQNVNEEERLGITKSIDRILLKRILRSQKQRL